MYSSASCPVNPFHLRPTGLLLAYPLTALMPDSCWESCRTMAMTKGWRYIGVRNSVGMVTFFSNAIFIPSSFISWRSAVTSSVPRRRTRAKGRA